MKLNTVVNKVVAVMISIGLVMPNPAYAAEKLKTANSESALNLIATALTGTPTSLGASLIPAYATRSETRQEMNAAFLRALSQFKAFPKRFVGGENVRLWVPTRSLTEPLEPRQFGDVTLPAKVSPESIRDQEAILAFVREHRPKAVGMQRFIDVGGSSIDLRALQKLLTKLGINALDFLTSTTIVAGSFPLELQLGEVDVSQVPAGFDAKDVIQYVINYKKAEGDQIVEKTKTYTVVRQGGKLFTLMEDGKTLRAFFAEADGQYEVWGEKEASRMQKRKAGQVIDGQMGAFAYFMSQIGAFGLRGDFRTLQPVAEAGGLGRSGGSNAMILALASQISGANLTKGDVQAEAVEKEGNGEDHTLAVLLGYTGGQESGATLQGGASQMIHLTEIKDEAGNYVWPVGTELVVALTKTLEEANERMLSHVALVQPGLPFQNGSATIRRTAGGINTTWCERGKHPEDVEGIELHGQKTLVAMVAAYGIAHDRWDLVLWSQNEHRRIRNELDKGFYQYALMALEGVQDRPVFADKYLQILKDDAILNRYLQWHIKGRDDASRPFDLRKVSLYSMTQDPLISEVTRVVREITGIADLELTDPDSPAAVFVPGAGGTGSPAVVLAKTPELLQEILKRVRLKNTAGQEVPLSQFKEEDVLKVMGGTGLLQGYMQPTAGKALTLENLPKEVSALKEGYEGVYDQETGTFYIAGDTKNIPAEVLKLPRVKLLADNPNIERAYTYQNLHETRKRSESRNEERVAEKAPELAPVDFAKVIGGVPLVPANRAEIRGAFTSSFQEPVIFDAEFAFNPDMAGLPMIPALAGQNPAVVIVRNRSEARMLADFNAQLPAGYQILAAQDAEQAVSIARQVMAERVRRGLAKAGARIRAIVTASSAAIIALKNQIGDQGIFIATQGWLMKIADRAGLTAVIQQFAAALATAQSA